MMICQKKNKSEASGIHTAASKVVYLVDDAGDDEEEDEHDHVDEAKKHCFQGHISFSSLLLLLVLTTKCFRATLPL